jgi:hypothetical protein
MRHVALLLLVLAACKDREKSPTPKTEKATSLDAVVSPCANAMRTPAGLDKLLDTIEADRGRGLSQLELMKADLELAERSCTNTAMLIDKVIANDPSDPAPKAARARVAEHIEEAARLRPRLLNLLDAVDHGAPRAHLEPLYDAYVREVVGP